MWDIQLILAVLAVSASAGFLAGLLGVGGGLLLVPVTLWVLHTQDVGGAHAQHLAVGTSFLVMVFTSFSSALAQHRKRAVRWDIVRGMVPAMVAGVGLGAALARLLPNQGLQLFFIVFVLVVALQTLLGLKPKPTRQLPGAAGKAAAGGTIGLVSSWVGIGGGSMSVPLMLYCNVPVREAVGTSAALGWPIAAAGALGYLVAGWGVAGLPAATLGFWYWPLALLMALATVSMAPLGVRAAHRLPPEKLKAAFGLLLLLIAAQMLYRWLAA